MCKNPSREERLNAIAEEYVLAKKKCAACNEKISEETAWVVTRYGIDGTEVKFYYCKNCFQTKEEVLEEIDTDEYMYGICNVDDFVYYTKKDYKRAYAKRVK